MEVRAIAKSVSISPRKAKLIIDLIRGKKLNIANGILATVESTVKVPIGKVVNSAAANATNNNGLDVDKLFIKEIYVTPAAMQKRMRPRAKGSGNRILKRKSHITVVVAELT